MSPSRSGVPKAVEFQVHRPQFEIAETRYAWTCPGDGGGSFEESNDVIGVEVVTRHVIP